MLVGTASPVTVQVGPMEHHLTPAGSVCMGVRLENKVIGRCAVPEETAEEFLGLDLFARPVTLALNVRPSGPVLEANLLALVPYSEAMASPVDEEEREPWKQSVPDLSLEGEDDESGSENRLVGVFLGQVVRFQQDRKYPSNLVREAADMLAGVVRGRIGKLVDRMIEELSTPEP